MRRYQFDSFSMQAPSGWVDITDEVEADHPPLTLAKPDGVGALQFSIALYSSGAEPNPCSKELLQMVNEFGRARGWRRAALQVTEEEPLRLAAASFHVDDTFYRVWYISDGLNFAFITYNCEWKQEHKELEECERMVRTIRFTA